MCAEQASLLVNQGWCGVVSLELRDWQPVSPVACRLVMWHISYAKVEFACISFLSHCSG